MTKESQRYSTPSQYKKNKSNSSPGRYTLCNRTNCSCYKAALTESTFHSTVTQEKITLFSNSSCKTNNCIYLVTYGICRIQHVGHTSTPFSKWLNIHCSWCTAGKNCPVTRHEKSKGNPFDSIKFQIIDQSVHWSNGLKLVYRIKQLR